ncbi:MAG TPA: GDSL family lipase [Candidatus Aphodoplasma excrementigallinarum]|uniref:GDSL family lipase n=1 Tax=Candidatus Aphodoplasma excrementigallinarum TaxID=2840673 RepID=A0A9D1NJ19_9FIRM|nr:GDSL family lipase [Candidatus Aphodoplasma excrementigallinarum]
MRVTEKLNSGAPVTLAFFGDSVTHGYFESFNGMHGTTDYDAVYHTVLKYDLAKRYPDAEIHVINAGVGGDSAQKGLVRLGQDVIDQHPDFAVVCFGLNDINGTMEDYTGALGEIFGRLLRADVETVFLTPNMLNTYVDDSLTGGLRDYAYKTAEYQTGGRMDAFMDAAMRTAAAHGVAVCDCYRIWKQYNARGVDTTALLANRINHPARDMHKLFAEELLKMVTEEGGAQPCSTV